MSLKNTITTTLGRQLLQVQKHSPVMMLGAGLVGIGASLVLTARATLKLDDILEKGKAELDAIEEPKDDSEQSAYKRKRSKVQLATAIEVAKIYALPAVVAVGTIGFITGSHKILSTRNAGVTAAYAALDKGFREYRSRIVDELGPEKETQLYHDLVEVESYEETEEGPVPITILKANKGRNLSPYAQFFDECNRNWRPEAFMNQFFIQSKEKFANDLLVARGHLFLHEVYDMLGYDRTPESSVVGWIYNPEENTDNDNHVSFGIFRDAVIGQAWVNGDERSILLDFNVDGVIWDKI